jgi:hypothetical protein
MSLRGPWPVLFLVLPLLPGVAAAQRPGPGQDAAAVLRAGPNADWRSLAVPGDRDRLAALPAAWAEALESARSDGRLRDVTAAGALLDSRPGLEGAQPEPGAYRCRTLRLGATEGEPAFTAFPAFRCRIAMQAGLAVFEKLTGSQRIAGIILPDSPLRSVLIGTEAVGPDATLPRYGENPQRDRIALVERIAPDRWRLVFPRPSNGAIIEVMELTRATAAPAPSSSPAPARSGTSRRG